MKEIYVTATSVYAWLGVEADNSDLAMDFIAKKGARNLRHRGPGFRNLWSREEGKALHDLCERSYWRRMWIIQEIIHAEKITVWCGRKSFEWGFFENLYLNLKILEDKHWFAHHGFAVGVLQSSAGVMVWQRAIGDIQRHRRQDCKFLLKSFTLGNVQMFGTKSMRWLVWRAQIRLLFLITRNQHAKSTLPFRRKMMTIKLHFTAYSPKPWAYLDEILSYPGKICENLHIFE
jgi:hypothetical protein